PAPLRRSNQLKRKTFPWCVAGMLVVVAVGALGAASDPGTGRPNTADMADIHLYSALAGLAFIGWTYFQVWQNIAENQLVIQQIVGMVGRIRRERGLDVEPTTAPTAEPPNDPPAGPSTAAWAGR